MYAFVHVFAYVLCMLLCARMPAFVDLYGFVHVFVYVVLIVYGFIYVFVYEHRSISDQSHSNGGARARRAHPT